MVSSNACYMTSRNQRVTNQKFCLHAPQYGQDNRLQCQLAVQAGGGGTAHVTEFFVGICGLEDTTPPGQAPHGLTADGPGTPPRHGLSPRTGARYKYKPGGRPQQLPAAARPQTALGKIIFERRVGWAVNFSVLFPNVTDILMNDASVTRELKIADRYLSRCHGARPPARVSLEVTDTLPMLAAAQRCDPARCV